MTLHPALARLERGFRRMWGWAVAKVRGARPYRYDGEEEAHAEQLRETQIALGLMASADASDPDQLRMATEIEDGAEARLVVLLGKPRLSLAEKRERDDIQRRITERRQGFASHLEQRTDAGWRPQGFAALALMGGMKLWMIFGGVAALAGLWGGVQTWRVDNLKDDLREARAERAQLERSLAQTTTERDMLADAHELAIAQSQQTSATIEAERARRLRAESEARRIRNEMARARDGVPDIDYGFGGVRDDGAATPSAGGGDTAGGRSR